MYKGGLTMDQEQQISGANNILQRRYLAFQLLWCTSDTALPPSAGAAATAKGEISHTDS